MRATDLDFGPLKKNTWMKAIETRVPWSSAFCFNWVREKADYWFYQHVLCDYDIICSFLDKQNPRI